MRIKVLNKLKELKVLRELVKLADHLDRKGLRKEADHLDALIKKAYYGSAHGNAQQTDMSFSDAQKKAKSLGGIYWEQDDGDVVWFDKEGNANGVGEHQSIASGYPYYYQSV